MTKKIAVFIPLAIAVILHFLKLLIPEYRNELPYSLVSLTPETICATSTIIFPFIYWSKSTTLKDYMVILGLTSGVLTLLSPGDIIGYNPLNIEVMRFFVAHLVIFMVPLFMVLFNIHRPSKKWFKHTILTFLVVILLVLLDNVIYQYIIGGKEGVKNYFEEMKEPIIRP